MDGDRPLLMIRETAALVALSTRTIHGYIAEAKLKAHRVGGEKTIRIKLEGVDALPTPVGDQHQLAQPSG